MSDPAEATDGPFWADATGEQALQRYRTLVNAVDDGIYQLDADGRFVAVNDGVLELTGYTRADLLGERLSRLLAEEDIERIERELSGQPGSNDAATVEVGVRTADGGAVPCELRVTPLGEERDVRASIGVVRAVSAGAATDSISPVRADDGADTGAPKATRDTTDRKERKRELQRIERRFEAIFEDPNILVGLLAPDGTVLDINQTAMEYVDADLAAVTGEPFWETPWWGADDGVRSDAREWTERAAAGEYVDFEADLTGPDGESYTISGHFRPVVDDEDEVVSIIVSDRDVTERKEHERYLEDVKSRLEAATEAGAVGTWEWKIPEDEMIVGGPFAQKFGIDPEAAREGVSLDQFTSAIHEGDRDRIEREIQTAVETGGEYEAEYRVVKDGGEVRWVVARGHVERDEEGNPTRFPGALTDITERKRAELELQRSNEQLEALFEVLPVGVVVAEADGTIVSANDTAREIWTGDAVNIDAAEEYEQQPVFWADTGDRVEPEEMTLARVVGGEAVFEPDVYEIETGDGERRIVEVEGRPIWDETGEVVRGVITISDATERREYERKLRESNERLEQFAYSASHDLQEPLRMISSYLQLLERRYGDTLDEDGEEFLEFAVDGAERMKAMIEGLLEYSRIEARGDPLEPTDLEGVLDDVCTDLQFRIEESDAEITSEPLPAVTGDAGQLRQVFQNVLENAIEYSGDAPPRIHISADRAGEEWRISVADEGIGIDPADQERIFEVFQRLHSRAAHEGTGIGLALCERIVERHGGEIRVDSDPGEGTTFTFTLPAVDGDARDRD